jgi:hypothetical protein
MRKQSVFILCSALLVVVLFGGCGKKPSGFGNFAKADSVELVQDAMSALMANYPPAKTRLALVQEADDVFGVALVEALRANGYAVAEHAESDKYLPDTKKPVGLAFAYVIDDREDELCVVLHVGAESLNRLYRIQRSDDALQYIPQGYWTRKQ